MPAAPPKISRVSRSPGREELACGRFRGVLSSPYAWLWYWEVYDGEKVIKRGKNNRHGNAVKACREALAGVASKG